MPGGERIAAASALAAYLATVLPRLRKEMRRWHAEAEQIPDPELRRVAVAALEEKGSNVEAVAVFATLAPRRHRATALRAMAALQIGIDCRDGLEEAGSAGATGGGYLELLERAWRTELGGLPGARTVGPVAERAAARCAEGQRLTHVAGGGDAAELERWARSHAVSGYEWWELGAGASSSVAAHALIAAAADSGTAKTEAEAIDAAYFPSVGALTVILDDLVDREADRAAGEHSYLPYYAGPEQAAERIAAIGTAASAALAGLPQARRHVAILAGVAAFYLSSPESETALARPIRERLFAVLGPAAGTLSVFVRLRRLGG